MIRSLKILLISLGVIVVALSVWYGCSIYFLRHVIMPTYVVYRVEKGFETRDYNPYIIAEVIEQGTFGKAMETGTQKLKEYYKNFVSFPPLRETMTGEKHDTHLVSVILPQNLTATSTPQPSTKDIQLHIIRSSRMAVITFTGNASDLQVLQEKARLIQYLRANEIEPLSEPIYIRYTPNFLMPFLIRNEVQVVI
jgi:hypothetical protein